MDKKVSSIIIGACCMVAGVKASQPQNETDVFEKIKKPGYYLQEIEKAGQTEKRVLWVSGDDSTYVFHEGKYKDISTIYELSTQIEFFKKKESKELASQGRNQSNAQFKSLNEVVGEQAKARPGSQNIKAKLQSVTVVVGEQEKEGTLVHFTGIPRCSSESTIFVDKNGSLNTFFDFSREHNFIYRQEYTTDEYSLLLCDKTKEDVEEIFKGVSFVYTPNNYRPENPSRQQEQPRPQPKRTHPHA